MSPATRKILDQIDEFLLRSNDESAELWHILTALRGPDDPERDAEKSTTTAVIRSAAFPRCGELPCMMFGSNTYVAACFAPPDVAFISPSESWSKDYHFNYHVRAAAKALDLIPAADAPPAAPKTSN